MSTTNLTPEEVRFLDQYVRELHVGAGVATQQLHERGIYYSNDLFGHITYLWDRNWALRGDVFPYPQKDDPSVVCPWASPDDLASRVGELFPDT